MLEKNKRFGVQISKSLIPVLMLLSVLIMKSKLARLPLRVVLDLLILLLTLKLCLVSFGSFLTIT